MRKDILFTTLFFNQTELYQKMASMIDVNVFPLHHSDYLEFYYMILTINWGNIKWVIQVDGDCFIFDLDRMYNLIKYMEKENFDVAGIPDGGVIDIRPFNPISVNPFFVIFNYSKIQDMLLNGIKRNYECADLIKYAPTHLYKEGMKYNYANKSEEYYPLFFKLLREDCKFLYLDGIKNNEDNASTYLLDDKNKPFLIHTWFARRYTPHNNYRDGIPINTYYPRGEHRTVTCSKEYNTQRIDDIFEKHKTKELGIYNFERQKYLNF